MRKITLRLKDKDYLDFMTISNESGLSPEEKLGEVVEYYLIIERNRKKFAQKLL